VDREFLQADMEKGYMTWTNEEIFQCFKPVIDRAIKLIGNQITAVRAQGKSLQVRSPTIHFVVLLVWESIRVTDEN